MCRLYIAEKPSVAKALAEQLGNPRRADGYFDCDDGIVSYCIGHLLENASPDEYTSPEAPKTSKGNKIWRTEDLPIIPSEWIYHPKKETKKQLNVLGKLLKRKDVTEVVNAADCDREGQLLVDQVLEHFNCKKPCLRFWVSAQDSVSLQRGLENMRPNSEFKGWSDAASARSKADWLIGMNFSRSYTLAADRGGQRSLLTVGRVQTPTLSLVVERDRTIENFIPVEFYKIEAEHKHEKGVYLGSWRSTVERQGIDPEGRIVDHSVAVRIASCVKGAEGVISEYHCERKKQAAPIPFSLAELTMLASKLHGMTAENVLKVAQSLYEHKLTSYPRTDTGYLPESQHADAPAILTSIAANFPTLANTVEGADPSLKSKAWATSRTTAHHGIICTAHKKATSALSKDEAIIYELIARRYIAQFYPLHEYQDTRIETTIAEELFVTTGKTILKAGWRVVLPGGATKEQAILPMVSKGDSVDCINTTIKNAATVPPKHYTEGTLIYSMENIHRLYEGTTDEKSALREGDGIGTSATRASIISELKRRKYLEPKGKSIVSTQYGRSVVDAYPEEIKSAHLTAMNERKLKAIEQSGNGFQQFMTEQERYIREHVSLVNGLSVSVVTPPECSPGKKMANKNAVKSATQKTSSGYSCKQCGSGLVQRTAKEKKTKFWGCASFPKCRSTYKDKSGKPVL
ncbi:DNA topoisomerase 3 [Maritalea sp.]|uniref:DNA topoisomerase 3 n=1 Tax=Maritalea sp. TaxID=2003361 RepID=UPI003EF19D0D